MQVRVHCNYTEFDVTFGPGSMGIMLKSCREGRLELRAGTVPCVRVRISIRVIRIESQSQGHRPYAL